MILRVNVTAQNPEVIMPGEIFIISIVAIVFGTGLIGLVSYGIYKLVKAKIDQGNRGAGQIDPQFFRALGDFKKKTEKRLSNLEAIVTDLEEERYLLDENEGDQSIEIESEDVRSGKEEAGGGNLRNMLNE